MNYDEEPYLHGDMARFMTEVFAPHLQRVDRHIEADDRRFEKLNDLVGRVSTSIEVSASVQQALLTQSEKVTKNWWVKLAVIAAALSPVVAISIAIWK